MKHASREQAPSAARIGGSTNPTPPTDGRPKATHRRSVSNLLSNAADGDVARTNDPLRINPAPGRFPPGTYKVTEGAAADFTQGFIGGLAARMNLGGMMPSISPLTMSTRRSCMTMTCDVYSSLVSQGRALLDEVLAVSSKTVETVACHHSNAFT